MHHVVLERWSRGESWLHRRDARAKVVATAVFLLLVATAERAVAPLAIGYGLLLLVLMRGARLPIGRVLGRSALVLPFGLAFAAISALAGQPARGAALLGKSYLSALAVLLLISTTPLASLVHGLERMGVPRFLLLVAQFLYRYLFVISEEAQHMRVAALARGASGRRLAEKGIRFRAAAGALAVLFSRSYQRASDIHRAMLARGFGGRFQPLSTLRFERADAVFLVAAMAAPAALRAALEGWLG